MSISISSAFSRLFRFLYTTLFDILISLSIYFKNKSLIELTVKKVMTKNPLSVDKDMLAVKSLAIMSENKITSLCVHKKKSPKRTIGVLHIHNILDGNIS